jgi:hypothetical protein
MLKEVIDRVDPPAELIDHHPWQHRITGPAHRPDPGNNQPRHTTLPSRLVPIHPASILVINEDEACPANGPGRDRSTKNEPLVRSTGRCTDVGEIPIRLASSRLDQCVAPSGVSSKVRTITSSTWASVMVRGTPGRGSSPSPSSRFARKRARHLLTVPRFTRSRAATAILEPPSAQASTIRARSASP